jgi:hypothetical protein
MAWPLAVFSVLYNSTTSKHIGIPEEMQLDVMSFEMPVEICVIIFALCLYTF